MKQVVRCKDLQVYEMQMQEQGSVMTVRRLGPRSWELRYGDGWLDCSAEWEELEAAWQKWLEVQGE